MKFVHEYRDAGRVEHLTRALSQLTAHPWTIMEICGGQTHTIVKYGLDRLIPPQITLVHGPGCPVCVTDVEIIDQAIDLASRPEVILCSFGDMLRVPGSQTDLLAVKAAGGQIQILYSPVDALSIATAHPDREVVFFAVGFETTAPATAMAVYQARQQGITNFSLLVSHVRVPPAMEVILGSPQNRIQGFLAAGHVCTVMGMHEYESLAQRYQIPIVVTGFEPLDIVQGIHMCVQQLEQGRAEVENQYARSVRPKGNLPAQQLLKDVFEVVPRQWRGIGMIPNSGLGLQQDYAEFDAVRKFGLRSLDHIDQDLQLSGSDPQAKGSQDPSKSGVSPCGLVLQGIQKPHECPHFGNDCKPEHPLGAPMVSSEGACAAYYRYRKQMDLESSGSSGSSVKPTRM